jgi:hypothetical protein
MRQTWSTISAVARLRWKPKAPVAQKLAERRAILLGDQDGLDAGAVAGEQHGLHGPVAGAVHRGQIEAAGLPPPAELVAERRRQVRHPLELLDTAPVEPARDLLGAVRLDAVAGELSA